MKYSQLLAVTRKELPNTFGIHSQDLLVKAGYIRQLGAGIFTAMHLAHRTFRKIEQILREEMDRIGGVEISMPVVHPAELWKKTGRYNEIDDSLVRFTDRADRAMVLAMTHEEVIASLCKSDITSYRQLPKLVYQMQTKFRDEARSRGGLIRVREFVMKDSYSLDTSWEGLAKQYEAHFLAYFRIFARAALPVMSIESDVGMMGGKVAHEYMYITDIGEDTIFICEETGYKANKEIASFKKPVPVEEEPKPKENVHTPDAKTIEQLSEFLSIPASNTGKVVFFSGSIDDNETVIVALVRGDMEVNINKLQKLSRSKYLLPATDEEILNIGCVPGYASPMNIDRDKAVVIADDLIVKSPNLVMGANEVDYHTVNVCYGRDFEADLTGDIVSAFEGAIAPDATSDDQILSVVRGVEVGNIFQLGTKYTDGLEAFFTGMDGKPKPIIMGSYGIGVGRLLGCLAEEYHDEYGLMMPISVAPYEVIIVGLLDNEEVINEAQKLYDALQNEGIEVLFDDRHKKVARPGEKFSDADLIGIPIRLTISSRSIQNGGVELKLRHESEKKLILLQDVVATIREARAVLFARIIEDVDRITSSLST